MPSENVQGQEKTIENTQQYANSYVHKFSYYLVYSTKLSYKVSSIGYRDALPHVSSP